MSEKIPKRYECNYCCKFNIVKNVLTDQNYIDTNKDVFIEETSGIRKIVVPNVNPYNLITNLATEALSIILFITISITSLSNFALSLAISAIFQASCFFFGNGIFEG